MTNQSNIISGAELRLILKRKRILINDLIEEFGYNRTTISRYLNDKQQMPAHFIINVAAFAGLSIEQLLEKPVKKYNTQLPNSLRAAEPLTAYQRNKKKNEGMED
jgi:transcriptional regulator with XRE-family HTH domain